MKPITTVAILFLLISMSFAHTVEAQSMRNKQQSQSNESSEFNRDRLFFEGNIGANVSNGQAQVSASPIIGYHFTNRFSAGAGPRFDYVSFNGNSLMIYGARALGRYNIMNGFFAHGEYEIARSNRDNCGWRSHFPVGGGMRKNMGNGINANFTVLYDLFHSRDVIGQDICDYSKYATFNGFIIRGGVSLGLGSLNRR